MGISSLRGVQNVSFNSVAQPVTVSGNVEITNDSGNAIPINVSTGGTKLVKTFAFNGFPSGTSSFGYTPSGLTQTSDFVECPSGKQIFLYELMVSMQQFSTTGNSSNFGGLVFVNARNASPNYTGAAIQTVQSAIIAHSNFTFDSQILHFGESGLPLGDSKPLNFYINNIGASSTANLLVTATYVIK